MRPGAQKSLMQHAEAPARSCKSRWQTTGICNFRQAALRAKSILYQPCSTHDKGLIESLITEIQKRNLRIKS